MNNTSRLLRAAADDLEAMEAERDHWKQCAADLAAEGVEAQRKAYRRGYLAGRSSMQRGAPAVTNPERRARGEFGAMFR